MASAFIFLTKFCLIFVIHQRVNANEQLGNCKVNETTGVITEISFLESPKDLNCNSGGSKKAGQRVGEPKTARGGSLQFRDAKNWMALNCKAAGYDSNATFCFHGPNNPPTISGTNILVSGIPIDINCTINGVYPEPRIEWYLGDTEIITMNAILHAEYDNTGLFNATSSLSFTPELKYHRKNLTCSILPSVRDVWTPSNTSVELHINDFSNKSAVLKVDEATSSSLYISWQLPEGTMTGSSILTLRYCRNSTGDLDNVTTMDNLTCLSCKEVAGLNGTSYNVTGLEPFEWYNLTLLADGNTVASKIVSTAPLSPEYYGVYMTFSPEKEILEISRLPMMNRTVPSDLCFAIIQTEGSKPNCLRPILNCLDAGSKIDDFKEEDIPGIGLVSSGRGLCSHPTLYSPIILNSPGGMMDMPHVSIVMWAVIGTSVFILLSSVALLLFLNFICKGIGCLGKEGMNIAEEDRITQINAEHQYQDLQNRDASGTGYMSMRSTSSTVAATNNSDDYMEYETIPSGAEECPALLSKATECSYVNTGQRSTLTNKKQDTASSWEDAVTYF